MVKRVNPSTTTTCYIHPMSARDVLKQVRNYLKEAGFTSVRILAIGPRVGHEGQVEVTVDVGVMVQRIGKVFVDAASLTILSHEIGD
jgi:hypothetical protein